MRVLLISPMVPMPADDGGKLATLHMVRALRSCGAEVHFVAPDARAYDAGSFAGEVEHLSLVHLDPRNSPVKRLRYAASRLPYAAEKFFSQSALEEIRQIAARGRFDAVQTQHLHVMRFAQALKREFGLPSVLHAQNVESTLVRSYAEVARNPLVRLYAMSEYRKMYRFEVATVRDCDIVFPLTRIDAAALREMAPDVPILPLPYGMDLERLRFNHCHLPRRLLLLANFDWLPNRDSFEYFVHEIHPILSTLLPDLTTVVAGKGLEMLNRRNLPASIVFRGYLPDVNEASTVASVALVPLRAGSGVRVKILELMAMGLSVVATPVAAQGIEARPDEQLVIADTPRALAGAVKRLLEDESLSRRIALSARKFVEEHHTTAAAAKVIADAYRSLLENRRMRPKG